MSILFPIHSVNCFREGALRVALDGVHGNGSDLGQCDAWVLWTITDIYLFVHLREK